MISHIKASKATSQDSRLFKTVVQHSVPMDQEPNEIDFSLLTAPKDRTFEVHEKTGHLVQFGAAPYLVRALGLLTCAAVCFVNWEEADEPRGYVYHANSGNVPWDTFKEIIAAIGATESSYRHVQVLYAHPNKTDGGYQKNIDELHRWLLSKGRVVEVTHLALANFSMNQTIEVGY